MDGGTSDSDSEQVKTEPLQAASAASKNMQGETQAVGGIPLRLDYYGPSESMAILFKMGRTPLIVYCIISCIIGLALMVCALLYLFEGVSFQHQEYKFKERDCSVTLRRQRQFQGGGQKFFEIRLLQHVCASTHYNFTIEDPKRRAISPRQTPFLNQPWDKIECEALEKELAAGVFGVFVGFFQFGAALLFYKFRTKKLTMFVMMLSHLLVGVLCLLIVWMVRSTMNELQGQIHELLWMNHPLHVVFFDFPAQISTLKEGCSFLDRTKTYKKRLVMLYMLVALVDHIWCFLLVIFLCLFKVLPR